MNLRNRLGALFAFVLALSCAPALAEQVAKAGSIEITGPFARATLPNSPTGGVYFTLRNTGTEDDRLLTAASPLAGAAQLHEMSVENDVAGMRELPDGIALPAGGTVALTPSGTHIMLTHLTQPLVKGETFSLTLTFEHAGPVTLTVPIGSIAAKAAP